MTEKIRAWAARPLDTRLIPLAFYALFSVIWIITLLVSRYIDCDTYYIIPQGREILASGFPRVNGFTFFQDHETTVQQWVYCVITAWLDGIARIPAVIAFGLAQALALFALIERRMRKYNADRFWSYLSAIIATMIVNGSYFVSLRPENATLMLLMLDVMILDKYKETGKPGYLYLLPLVTLAEINIHASMWPFHFCVLLANAFPNVLRSKLSGNQARPTWHLLPAVALMAGSLFLNPYGIDNVTYVFRSMSTFDTIKIAEQQNTEMITIHGIFAIAVIVILAISISHGKLSSTSAYACAGFTLLACMNYHNSMFLTIAITYIAGDLLKILAEKTDGTRLAGMLKNSMWGAIAAAAACVGICASQTFTEGTFLTYLHQDGSLGLIVRYIKDNDPDANILNSTDAGSYLEYYGLRNLFGDTRPELLNKSINKKENALEIYDLMDVGMEPESFGSDIRTIPDFLEAYDIKYVIVYNITRSWPALRTYLDMTDEYELADTGYEGIGGTVPGLVLYERKEAADE